MSKYEFSDKLRRYLTGRLDPSVVDTHIEYYEGYIDAEIRKGRSEEEVLSSLGDPRLIAKTITDSASKEEESSWPGQGPQSEGSYGREAKDRGMGWRFFKIPSLAVVVIVAILLLVAGFVVVRILPLIIFLLFISWLIRRFRQ